MQVVAGPIGSLLLEAATAAVADIRIVVLESQVVGRAPQCYGVEHRSENETWIWLEDVGTDQRGFWTADDVRMAGRHLGQLAGGYLLGRSLPEHPWLTQDILVEWCLDRGGPLEALPELLSRRPAVQACFPFELAAQVGDLWRLRDGLIDAWRRLPRTLVHGDTRVANVFRQGDQTVLVDWAYVGVGRVGQDLEAVVLRTRHFRDAAEGSD